MTDQFVYVVKCGYPFDGSSIQGVYKNVLDAIESCEQQCRFTQQVPEDLKWTWHAQNREWPRTITLSGLDRNYFECIWTIEMHKVIGSEG